MQAQRRSLRLREKIVTYNCGSTIPTVQSYTLAHHFYLMSDLSPWMENLEAVDYIRVHILIILYVLMHPDVSSVYGSAWRNDAYRCSAFIEY